MLQKIKQYKNLLLVALAIILVVGLIAADPLGFVTERRHQRAVIQNQIAVEKAEAEKQIAIIKAQTDAELERIRQGLEATDGETETPETETEAPTTETARPEADILREGEQ
jgi:Tfp pilus assembly protein PilX